MPRAFPLCFVFLLALPSPAWALGGESLKPGALHHEFSLGTTQLYGKEGLSVRFTGSADPFWDMAWPSAGYRLRFGLAERVELALHLNYRQKSGPIDLRAAYQIHDDLKGTGLALQIQVGLEAFMEGVAKDFLVPIELHAGRSLGARRVGGFLGLKLAPSPWTTGDTALWVGPSVGLSARVPVAKRLLNLRVSYLGTPDPPAGEPDVDWTFVEHVDGILFTELGLSF